MRRILVLDVEASCFRDSIFPSGEVQEIIEFGYSFLDLNDGSTSSHGIYVKPVESSISKYCEDLTGITQKLLDEKGVSFDQACKMMLEQGTNTVPWVSYGDWDERFIQEQCLRRGVRYPLSFEHYNVKAMVNDGFKDLIRLALGYTKGFGMKDALHLFGMNLQGRHHSGKADAENTARLLWKLFGMMDKQVVAKISSDGSRLPGRRS